MGILVPALVCMSRLKTRPTHCAGDCSGGTECSVREDSWISEVDGRLASARWARAWISTSAPEGSQDWESVRAS